MIGTWTYFWIWIVVVLVSGLAFQPRPTQHGSRRHSLRRPQRLISRMFSTLSTLIGTSVTRWLRLKTEPITVGRILILSCVAGLIQPLLGMVGLVLSVARLRRQKRDRTAMRVSLLRREMSLLIDLLRVAVSSGLTLQQSISVVCSSLGDAPVAHGELAQALIHAVDAVKTGERFIDSLSYLADDPDIGQELRPLLSAFLNSEQFGAPLDPALASLADEVRELRRRHGEVAARRVPVRMLAPLVLLLLPSFALLTIAPLLAGGLGSLSLQY
jgi:Flp pilus assembly protein TadB